MIHKLLMKNFHISLNEFLKFAKDSILLREHAKFVFTKGIDEIFKNLIELGKEINISRNDMSFIDIKNKAGGNYSSNAYDILAATRYGMIYPSLDPCIFEVKYPDSDIQGKAVSP